MLGSANRADNFQVRRNRRKAHGRGGLSLTNYEGVAGLVVDGRRESIFATDVSGAPRVVRALRARQLEEVGQHDPDIRGMLLGHPAVSPEALQAVAS